MKEKMQLCAARLHSMKKKKAVLIPAGLILLLIAAATVFVMRSRGGNINAAEMSVQSKKAEKGSISTTVVGTGSLEGGTSTDVVVPAGIKVAEVLVESGDTVTAGQTLATVEESSVASKLIEVKEELEQVQDAIDSLSDDAQDPDTTEYLQSKVLEGELQSLTEVESALAALMETKTITAVCAGTIDTVNVTADTEVSQTQTASAQNMSTVQSTSTADADGIIKLTATTDSGSGKVKITDCGTLAAAAPVTGEKPQEAIEPTDQYTGTISWNCSTPVFQAGTAYTATIKLTAREGYEFSQNIIPEVTGATVSYEVLESDAGESILKIKAKFAKTGEDDKASSQNNGTSNETGSPSTGNTADKGDNTSAVSESGSQNNESTGLGSAANSNTSGSNSQGSSGAASGSGTTSAGNEASSDSETLSQYSAYEAVAFGIASGSDMTVTIDVDELDILSVEKGQTASVTLDALDGEEFEGQITKVAASSQGESSSAKYEVQITLAKTDDMLLGMSASATIHIDESEDAVLIPVSALQEKDGSTFVYTEKDTDDNLSGEVEVETGLSDGSMVEITSGLKEGDTVYYLKAESTQGSDESGMMGQMDGQMPDGGQMPGNGEMPDMGNAKQKGAQNGGPGGGSSKSQ